MNQPAIHYSLERELKRRLRKIRFSRTIQRRYLSWVGTKWCLIEPKWLKRIFRENISRLDTEESKMMGRLRMLETPTKEKHNASGQV